MSDLPAPRLQLRWRKPTAKERARKNAVFPYDWTCVYELVLPGGSGDIRCKKGQDEIIVQMGRTFRGGERVPDDAPFRDGAHAYWDSKALGGIPVYVIAPDGAATRQRNAAHSPDNGAER